MAKERQAGPSRQRDGAGGEHRDHFTGTIAGSMTEYEGNPELDMTASSATGVSHGLIKQVAPAAMAGQLTVATYNLDNLSPTAAASKYAALGSEVVTHLGSPDILAVQEIQDHDGATDDGVVDATTTMTALGQRHQGGGRPGLCLDADRPGQNQRPRPAAGLLQQAVAAGPR
jgi:predicted extracellular nuclease